jgi:DNA-binding transcriptional regulator YiaG
MLEQKEIKAILPEIMKMVVSSVESVLTEHIHSTKYLDEYYINEKDFSELIGFTSKKFSDWKEQGRFNKAMHPATIGGKDEYVKYHRWFNVYKQEIEIPEQPNIEPPKPEYKLLTPKNIEAISPEIMKTAILCVEKVLTEYIHSPEYLDKYYIDEYEFRDLIGLSTETISDWKQKHKFDKAMLPNGDRMKFHRWFNCKTGKIELPEWGAKKEFKGK